MVTFPKMLPGFPHVRREDERILKRVLESFLGNSLLVFPVHHLVEDEETVVDGTVWKVIKPSATKKTPCITECIREIARADLICKK